MAITEWAGEPEVMEAEERGDGEPRLRRFFEDWEFAEMWRECVEFDVEEDVRSNGQ